MKQDLIIFNTAGKKCTFVENKERLTSIQFYTLDTTPSPFYLQGDELKWTKQCQSNCVIMNLWPHFKTRKTLCTSTKSKQSPLFP